MIGKYTRYIRLLRGHLAMPDCYPGGLETRDRLSSYWNPRDEDEVRASLDAHIVRLGHATAPRSRDG